MSGTRMSAFVKLSMRDLKHDIPASIVVFLIALPLCLGIALASGAPLFSGLLTGIIGGIVVASISGSRLSVSGPAAGLTVIVLGAIQTLGDYPIFLLALMIAGAIQLLLGLFKAGAIGNYFPSSVITGMLAAIGISIILQQIPVALGTTQPLEFSNLMGQLNIASFLICMLSILILIYWPKIKKLSIIPAPLLAVAVGIIGVLLLRDTPYSITEEQLVQIPAIKTASEFWNLFIFPDFSQILNKDVWVVAFTIAIIASLETLLNIEALDKIDPQKRITPTNRELFAQGTGNMISGLLGGLPLTSVIVRSSANTYAGGRTRQSVMLHGFWLLVAMLFLANIINYIPLACLAAILFVTGYKLANVALFKKMFHRGYDQFIPFIATVITVLISNLLAGVGVGIVVSVLFLLRNNMRNSFAYHEKDDEAGQQITVRLSEEVSFLNKAAIRRSLGNIPRKTKEIIIDGRQSIFIDKDVILLIQEFEILAKNQGKNIQLIEVYDKKQKV